MEERKLTGYPSIDRPWDRRGTKFRIPDCSFYDFFIHRSRINASRILSRCQKNVLSLPTLCKESLRYAKGLYSLGIRKGDIVPICLPPCNEGIVLFFALNRIGAVSTFLSASLGKEELFQYCQRYSAKIMISSNNEALSPQITILISGQNGEKNLSELAALGDSEITVFGDLSSEDNALICYTSGSTGQPKSIVLTNKNIMASMLGLKKTTHMQYGPQGYCLQVVPFNYPYGFIISVLFPMYVGKTVALTPNLQLNDVAKWIVLYRPKYIQAIPAFYKELMRQWNNAKSNLSFLKYEVCGGDTLDIETKKQISEFNKLHKCKAKICDGSGNGEGCGCLTTSVVLGSSNWESVGKPIKGLNAKVISPESGKELSYNETGLLCYSGPMIMKEYWGEPEETQKALAKDELGAIWFHTDTYAHIDEKGWLYLDGRDRRFFISFDVAGSPYKVYCDYVQSIIKCDSIVSDCAVVKREDKQRSFVPVAFVVLKPGHTELDLERIRKSCTGRLDNYSIPEDWHVLDALPLTTAGKINYTALEEMAKNAESLLQSAPP